jgi:hypothetical protein
MDWISEVKKAPPKKSKVLFLGVGPPGLPSTPLRINFCAPKAIIRYIKKKHLRKIEGAILWGWAHQGLNLGPPDYESGALTS